MRRRGQLSKFSIDRGWPHQVALPNNQVVSEHTAITTFCDNLSLCQRGHTFERDSQLYRPRRANGWRRRLGRGELDAVRVMPIEYSIVHRPKTASQKGNE